MMILHPRSAALRRAFSVHTLIASLVFICLLAPTAANALQNSPGSEFLIGLIPEENIFKQMKRHEPLAEYLSEELGIRVRFTILSRYPHIITRFISRGLDGAFFGAFTGLLAHETLDVEPIARPVNLDGNMTTKGYIFTRKNSGIRSMAQLRGKRMAFVDQVTASGYLFAVSRLKTSGVDDIDGYFKEQIFTGGHDSTVYTVLAGKAEAGTAKGRIVEKLMVQDPLIRDEIVVIEKSPDMPDNTFCVRKNLPEDFKIKLKNILLSMHGNPRGVEVLKQFEALRFTAASDADFNPVRRMAEQAGVDFKNFKYDY